MKKLVLALLCVALAAPARAASPVVTIIVTGAFARATAPGADTGAVYLGLQSDSADALTGVASNVASSAMLHQTTMQGMVMSMDMLDHIDLPAGQKVTLAPGGIHIMLEGLKQPLVKGSRIPLHLTFAHATPMDILVPVAGLAATAPNE
jgi:copper(I)-binding protein